MSDRESLLSFYAFDADNGVSPIARRLQIFSEVLFLCMALYVGLTARSPWIVLALALISTVAYAAQHWRLWRDASREVSRGLVLRGVLGTFVFQLLLIGIVYLAGLGLWTLINTSGMILPFGTPELAVLGILLAIALVSGLLVGWLERRYIVAGMADEKAGKS